MGTCVRMDLCPSRGVCVWGPVQGHRALCAQLQGALLDVGGLHSGPTLFCFHPNLHFLSGFKWNMICWRQLAKCSLKKFFRAVHNSLKRFCCALSMCGRPRNCPLALDVSEVGGTPVGRAWSSVWLPSRGCHLSAGSWQAWLNPREARPAGVPSPSRTQERTLGASTGTRGGCGLRYRIL